MPPSPQKRSSGTAEPLLPSAAASPSLRRAQTPAEPEGRAPASHEGSPTSEPEAGGPIVFYDGSCGLCGRLVTLLLAHEGGAAFRFAPLQGETARRMLGTEAAGLATVVLLRGGRCFTRSGAALRILAGLGGGWRAAALLLAVPRPLRDAAYGWVARRRARWFGAAQVSQPAGQQVCRPADAAQRARFLP